MIAHGIDFAVVASDAVMTRVSCARLVRWTACAICLVALVLGIAKVPDVAASHMHPCGDLPGQFAFEIKTNVKCSTAKRVVSKWPGTVRSEVENFRCRYRDVAYEKGKIRCRNDGKVVRWITAS